MRLLVVEIRRLFARRFFWIGAIVLLVGIAVSLAITFAQSEVPDADDRARANRAAAEQAVQAERDRQLCEQVQATRRGGGEVTPELDQEFPANYDCSMFVGYPVDTFLTDDPFRFVAEIEGRTHVLTVILLLFGFLVGATAVGAEWHHGTLAALLVWEPRRMRVYVAKLLGLLTSVSVVGGVAYAAGLGGHWGVARFGGVVGTLTEAFWRDIALTTARGLALTLVAAAIGYALALTLRRTAAALGVLIAYFGVVELGDLAFFGQHWGQYMLSTHVAAWLKGGQKLWIYDCDGAECTSRTVPITLEEGAAYVGGVALVALVSAALIFRRREVA